MFSTKFGIEIEFTGITRRMAAEVLNQYFHPEASALGPQQAYSIMDNKNRAWNIVRDGSIRTVKKEGRRLTYGGDEYSVELITPVLTYYEDIVMLQELVRKLRKYGGVTNNSCGIHIHLDGASHTPRSIRNFINLIAAHNDLFYKALQIHPDRIRYCKKMDEYLVEAMNRQKPKTMREIEEIWYAGYHESRNSHYHDSRYHFLNLHCFFHGNHTVELRGFNSELHAGKIRAYVVFALAINHQALTQKSASARKVQEENEKFAMRVYLNRIGLIGDEFKACREHLYKHLNGNAAWRYGSKEACRSHVKRKEENNNERENN